MNPSRFVGAAIFALVLLGNLCSARADSPAEKEAEEYMQTWEERGREACKDNERGCAAAGHALDRAAAAYEMAGKLVKAIAVRKMILDPQWHLDYTDYGRTAAFSLARNYQSIAEYAEAASLIETAVRRFSKSDEAPNALHEAITLRLALGEIDRAVENLFTFAKNYGTKRSADVPKIVVEIATASWGEGRAKETQAFVEKWMAHVDRNGTLHHRALMHALAGRLYARDGATAKATAEYEIVRALWAHPEDAVKQLQALGGSENEQDRRLAQTLTVVGEALFFFAEQKRAIVEALRFPEYAGAGDKESVQLFINTKIAEWLKTKQAAMDEAEREYLKILNVQPVPPPRWIIASAGRVGLLWSKFVSEFYRAPTPKEWKSSAPLPGTSIPGTEIKKMYLEQLSSLSEPYKERSKQAFKVCANFSMKFQWVDEHSRACVAWLEKNYRKEWIPLEELKPAPNNIALPVPTSIVMPSL